MLVVAALLLAQDAPAAARQKGDAIVVIARKLREWRGRFRLHEGAIGCVTEKTSGDKAIDAVGCEALRICTARSEAQIVAAADRKLSRQVRRQMQAANRAALIDCMDNERPPLISALADRRAAAQQEGGQ